jgi:hypothetical protein
MSLGSVGWGIMIGWTLFFILMCLLTDTVRLVIDNAEFILSIELALFSISVVGLFIFMITLLVFIIKSDVK